MSFMCKVKGCARRYRMKYTRGFGVGGEARGALAELQVGKVAARNEILQKHLEEGDLPEGVKGEIHRELNIVGGAMGNFTRRRRSRSGEKSFVGLT